MKSSFAMAAALTVGMATSVEADTRIDIDALIEAPSGGLNLNTTGTIEVTDEVDVARIGEIDVATDSGSRLR